MPRPCVPLEEHREFITDCIAIVGLTQEEVCNELAQSHGIEVGRTTLVKALARWGVRTRRAPNFSDTPALRVRLHHFFHQTRLIDAEIAKILTDEEGMNVTRVRVAKLRKKMGLYKRVDANNKEVTEKSIEQVLAAEYAENEDVRQLGQKALYRYLRQKHGITGRDRIIQIAKKLDPEGPERRQRAQRKEARRTGWEKERRAKELQQQATTAEQHHQQPATTTNEQQPLPSQYLPLDPAMYHGDYHTQSQQQQQQQQQQGMPDIYYESVQPACPADTSNRHMVAAGPDLHHYPQHTHQGDSNHEHDVQEPC